MEKEISVSPQELYYLGNVLQAKYIDYAYVAAMDDIGQNYALFENETKASLVSKGVLTEDFGGNIEMSEVAVELLKPIFFGEVETSIDICTLGEESSVSIYKFHFHDDAITMVTGDSGKLYIRQIDLSGIKEIVKSLISENYSCNETVALENITPENVTRFVAAKSIKMRERSVVKTFLEADGVYYRESGENLIESVTREMFISDVFETVKGVL